LDAFVCHGVSGFIGTLLTGVFAVEGGLAYGGGLKLFGAQVVGGVATAAYSAAASGALFWVLSRCFAMRVPAEHECSGNGLDCIVHGESAYGDGACIASKQDRPTKSPAAPSPAGGSSSTEVGEDSASESGGGPSPERVVEQV